MRSPNIDKAALVSTPASGAIDSSFMGRLVQVRAYQHLARVRLQEKLTGSPTGALLYDLLMRDQLAFIKLNAPARHV